MWNFMLLKGIKGILKHICCTLIVNIFKKYFNTEVQEELLIDLIRSYVLSTKTKADDKKFNIIFGNSKFKIQIDENKKEE